MKTLVLAGGCFWGVEAYFKQLNGVIDTECGYANGNKNNPTYEEVCHGYATHAEAVRIVYDETNISLNKLFEHFFRIIDPTSLNRQGNDYGVQYRSGIYFEDLATSQAATSYIESMRSKYVKPIVVAVEPLKHFYDAETYHQDYLDKNPGGYCHIDLSKAFED